MNKDTYIRTRLNEQTKSDFDTVCQALHVVPSEQLRVMIEEFVARHNGSNASPYILQIHRPGGYDYGVWRVTISLRNSENGLWGGTPIPFALPELPSRIVESDPEYRAIVIPSVERGPVLGGRFENGVWRGHIRTNGCEEDLNPTPLQKVEEAIRNSVDSMLARFHGYDGFIQREQEQKEQYKKAQVVADWIRKKVIWTKSRKAAGTDGALTPGVYGRNIVVGFSDSYYGNDILCVISRNISTPKYGGADEHHLSVTKFEDWLTYMRPIDQSAEMQ